MGAPEPMAVLAADALPAGTGPAQQLALDALSAEHESLLAFVYAAPVGLVQTDLAGDIELVSPVTAMMLMPLAKRGGLDNLFDVLAPVAPDLALKVAAYPHDHGVVCDERQLVLTQPGPKQRVVTLRLVKLDRARLMATLVDITAQVQAEAAQRLAEQRLQLAMSAAHAGDWLLEPGTMRLQMSPGHAERFGLSGMGAAGLSLDDLLAQVHPDDRANLATSLDEALRNVALWRTEFRLARPAAGPAGPAGAAAAAGPAGSPGTAAGSGTGAGHPAAADRWLTLHGRPLLRPGMPTLMAGVVLDTTHQRQADAMRERNRALELQNRALQESSRLKDHFVAAMSHELRTPLTSVIGFTELLRGGVAAPGSAQAQECLDQIATNGRHLLRLINDVLDLAKIDANKLEFQPAPLQLRALATEVRDGLTPQWQSKRLTVAVEVAEGLEALVLDPSRLRQVLYNLLSNAIKFTPEGGQVELRAWPVGGQRFELEVADTGIGIADTDIAKLFIEFQQLSAGRDRQHNGTGLGLALTKRLVQAQGGDIQVRSQLGQGTVFRVRLPQIHVPT